MAFTTCKKHDLPVFYNPDETGGYCPRCATITEIELCLPEFDPVEHPVHYNQGGVECIDAMRAAYGDEALENHCVMNAFKYIWRHRQKNGRQDLAKAIWYLRMATGDDPRKDK